MLIPQKNYLACCLALAGGGALAQSSVNLFGSVDLFVHAARSGTTHVTRIDEGGAGASRFGLRGSEDLGGGLRANYLLEAGFAADTGAGTIPGPGIAFTRQSYVGLSGPWGSVDAGRMYTPMFYTLLRADPFGVNALYSPLNLVAATDAQPGMRAFAARASNLLRYRTPAAQPWFADIAYAFGEAASPNSSNGNLWGATFGWNSKPFYLGYGLQKHRAGAADAPVPAPSTSSWQALSAGWDITPDVRISANLMRTALSGAATPDARIWQAGGEWRVTPLTRLLASYARRSVEGSPRGQSAWSFGVDHALGKRTQVYARWLGLENRGAAAATLAGVAVTANSGNDVRSLALGVKHDF